MGQVGSGGRRGGFGRRRRPPLATATLIAVAALALVVTSVVGSVPPPMSADPAAAPTGPPTRDGVAATDDAARVPSQSPADAARDGVVPDLAALSFDERLRIPDAPGRARVVTDEGVWVLSGLEVARSVAGEHWPILGDRAGRQGRDFVVSGDYGEVLLLDAGETRILRAFPFPGLAPQELLVTDAAVHCGRQGDGALPWSLLCRIDRTTLDGLVRVFPAEGVDDLDWLLPRPGWILDDPLSPSLGPLIEAGDAIVALGWGPEGRSAAAFDAMTLEPLPDGTVDTELVFGTVVAADPGGHLEVDPARMLHGDEAAAAYAAETGDDGGPPNDYVIQDPDDATVTYPVAEDVEVRMTLYWDHDQPEDFSKPLPWRDFAGIWADDAETVFSADDVAYARHGAYYRLVLVDGEVAWIEQQYLP